MKIHMSFEGLETEVAGIKMRTPIGLGAVVDKGFYGKRNAEEWAEMLLKTVDAGSGQVTIATTSFMTPEEQKELMELVRSEKEEYRVPAWQKQKPSIFPKTDRSRLHLLSPTHSLDGTAMDLFIPGVRMDPESRGYDYEEKTGYLKKKVMAILKEKLPDDVPIIGSVTGYGSLPEGWLPCVRTAEEWGADLIELNASCPIPAGFGEYVDWFIEQKWPARYPGVGLLCLPDIFEKIVKESAKAVHVPVGVKLSAGVGFPLSVVVAKRCRDAGAKFITTMNATSTIIPPDIYNRGKPITPHISGNVICGVGGPTLRLENYGLVGSIAKHVPGIDIIAVGGISTPEHVVEFLMLGAKATEQVTAVCTAGRGLFRREVAFLKNFLKEQGYGSVKDLVGLHQQYLQDTELVYGTEDVKYVAQTDTSQCTGCGICADLPCCMASYMENGLGLVDTERCGGCGWCLQACPQKARKLVRVK